MKDKCKTMMLKPQIDEELVINASCPLISRISGGPAGRRHSLFAPPDPAMGTRSHQELHRFEAASEEEEEGEREGVQSLAHLQIVVQGENGKEAEDEEEFSSSSSSENSEDCMFTFNVGGRIFQTYRRTLLRAPSTRLTLLAQCTSDTAARNEIFFDRNSDMFAAIVSFYRDGVLHCPRNVCAVAFCKELEFWGLNETWLSDCCQKPYNEAIGEMTLSARMKDEFAKIKMKRVISSPYFLRSRRGRLWEFLDNPDSSLWAKIWFFCFYIILLLTVLNVFVSTHEDCRVAIDNPFFNDHSHANNSHTIIGEFLIHQAENNPKIKRLLTTRVHGAIVLLELFCAVYFTVEFVLRAVVCPYRRLLFRRFLTWCDLLYLIPLWCELIMSYSAFHNYSHPDTLPWKLTLKTLMVLRVVRIFTLAKYYGALRILLLSIRASMKEILLLLCFVMFAMVMYASLVYCSEIFRQDSFFDNLFTGLWWSLITMTTVGYGDVVPKSWAGYLVGAACALTGIIIIGMPVPIITSNFHLYYSFQSTLDEEAEREDNEDKKIDPLRKRSPGATRTENG